MNRKLTYAIATLTFAVALIATPTKAHAASNGYVNTEGGGGGGGDEGSHGVGGSKLTGWFVQLLDSIGIR